MIPPLYNHSDSPSAPASGPGKSAVAGLLNLFKPVGASSAQFVYHLRPVFGIRKIGHAGTLDPRADGVLIACVGAATRLVERIYALPKHYRTTMRLGVTNACYDSEQPFEPVVGATPPTHDQIETTLKKFTGEFEQLPPAFSAARVGGISSYKLAQRGRPAAVRPKMVRIDRIDVLSYDWPALTLDIHCGKGTYIRSLARDLGESLACGACCEKLTRMAVGPFKAEASITQNAHPDAIRAALIPLEEANRLLSAFPSPI